MNGSSPPDGNLITDTALIRSMAESLVNAGYTIVALLQSYGGQVGTNALYKLGSKTRAEQGLAGGVSQLIYMCAFILPEGWSTYAQAQARGMSQNIKARLKFSIQDDRNSMTDPRGQLINNLRSDAEATTFLSTLQPWNLQSMRHPLSHCAWREIPVTYIHTTNDMSVVLPSQQLMVDRVKEAGLEDTSSFMLDTDHCPYLSAAKEVADIVDKVVARIGLL